MKTPHRVKVVTCGVSVHAHCVSCLWVGPDRYREDEAKTDAGKHKTTLNSGGIK